MTQTANIASLTKVVVRFRELGEDRVAAAMSEAETRKQAAGEEIAGEY